MCPNKCDVIILKAEWIISEWYKNCNLGDKSMSHLSKSGTILPSEYFDKWKGFLSAVH